MSDVRRFLKRHRLTAPDVPVWMIGMIAAGMWVAPLLLMVTASLSPSRSVATPQWFPTTIVLDNYAAVFERYPVFQWFINSVIVTVGATIPGVLLAAMAGYALARLNFPGRGVLFAVLVATLMIPAEVSIVPLLIGFLTVGLSNNYVAIILPSVASVFSLYILRQFYLGLPRELEDAAAIDGAGKFTIFLRIALPLSKAPLLAATILLFTANWNAYVWPLLIVFSEEMKTMPVGLAQLSPAVSHMQTNSLGQAMAAATLLTIPSLAIFLLLQRYFIAGVSRSGING